MITKSISVAKERKAVKNNDEINFVFSCVGTNLLWLNIKKRAIQFIDLKGILEAAVKQNDAKIESMACTEFSVEALIQNSAFDVSG